MNLYVHFPFCRAKCSYCALLSRAGSTPSARAAHVARVLRELPEGRFDTIYFGGGTPTLCDLSPVLAVLGQRAEGAEFTVELHPRDVTDSLLDMLRRGGVNRISLGVQSFDDRDLAAMGRGHSAAEAEAAFRRVRAVIPNVGLDLIAGWPGTSETSWRRTVECAVALDPVHISCYSLIREPKTRLDLAVRKGMLALPDDDEALGRIAWAQDAFAAAGLVRYEVSNYAVPGFECRHNCSVWQGEDYVGLGEGAHGRVGLRRTVGTESGYATSTVTTEEDAFERAVLGLRTAMGINLAELPRRFPVLASRMEGWRGCLEELVGHGILRRIAPGHYAPTARGFEVCDAVMAELV